MALLSHMSRFIPLHDSKISRVLLCISFQKRLKSQNNELDYNYKHKAEMNTAARNGYRINNPYNNTTQSTTTQSSCQNDYNWNNSNQNTTNQNQTSNNNISNDFDYITWAKQEQPWSTLKHLP